MNFDKEKLEALVMLPDAELWGEIRKIAGIHGFRLPEGMPPHEEIEKLRAICRDSGKISMLQAMRIVNNIKRRDKK